MPSTNLIRTTVSGAIFGAALTASGVWNPDVIIEQMALHDFHMLKVFMTAGGISALAIHVLSRSGYVPKKPRTSSSLITGIPYDGNIIGGAMLGVGMMLTGACPGTVLIQVVTHTYPGMYSFAGGVAGGIIYVPLHQYLKLSNACSKPKDERVWLYSGYGVSPDLAVFAWVGAYATVVGVAMVLAPPNVPNHFLPPIVGGLFIGAAQLASLILCGSPVGMSTAYEDVGVKFCGMFQKRNTDSKRQKTVTAPEAFAAGVLLGTAALVRMVPKFALAGTATSLGIRPIQAMLGGMLMVFGARLAGGCTSGHGISGMSMLATASVITVASMFAGGIGLTQLLM